MNQTSYKYIDEEDQHLHTLDGSPLFGTSTVVGIIAKPLTWWASGMAVGTLGWLNSTKAKKEERLKSAEESLEKIKSLSTHEYLTLLDKAYRAFNEKKESAAVQGTDMHSELENYAKSLRDGKEPEITDKNASFALWARNNIKSVLASEIHVYSREFWLGGIVDIVYEDLKGDLYIGDFKSSKEAYFSQFVQTALYGLQLTENKGGFDKEGNQILKLEKPIKGYAIFPFGSDFKEPTIRYTDEQWKQAAVGACALYKLNQKTNG